MVIGFGWGRRRAVTCAHEVCSVVVISFVAGIVVAMVLFWRSGVTMLLEVVALLTL